MPLRDAVRGVAAALRLAPRLLGRAPFGEVQRDFYAAVYALRSGGRLFVNKGIAPPDPAMPRLPDLEREAPHAALYFEVLRTAEAALGHPPARVTEVACGPGGGLRLAAALWPRAILTGSDIQPAAVRQAAALLARAAPGRAAFVAADGLRLPLAEGSVELLVSVEGVLNFGRNAFLAEVRRVLAPAGVLAATASMGRPFAETRAILHAAAWEAGLELREMRDLAPGIVEASRRAAAQRAPWLRLLPGPIRRPLADFAALPGSATFEAYASGARSYYLALLVRRG